MKHSKRLETDSNYKIIISDQAQNMEIELVNYLVNVICSSQAAKHLLDELKNTYDRIVENPYQFPEFRVSCYSNEYRIAKLSHMNYVVIYCIENEVIYVMGVFHGSENYITRFEK